MYMEYAYSLSFIIYNDIAQTVLYNDVQFKTSVYRLPHINVYSKGA